MGLAARPVDPPGRLHRRQVATERLALDRQGELGFQYPFRRPELAPWVAAFHFKLRQHQIEQGAPADVFFSPGVKQMDALQNGGLIINNTRQNLLNNKVVLVVPKNSTLDISDFMDLLNDDVKKIAIGDPEFVPIGTYGIQALDMFGITEQLQLKLILCSDVRQVLNYVAAGNVDAGIVFSTDAAITDSVKIAADAPDEVNSQIVYPVAVIKASRNVDAAKAYIAFLLSDEAKIIFEQYGFVVVNK